LYIALAGFNIPLKSQEERRNGIKSKSRSLGFLFILFIAENFIVSNNFGEAITMFPISSWMIVLLLANLIYAYGGIRYIISLLAFILSLRLFFGVPYFFKLETILLFLHPWASGSAEPINYIPSCFIGMIIGYLHVGNDFSKKNISTVLKGILFILVVVSFYFVSQKIKVSANDLYAFDECLMNSNAGLFLIYFLISLMMVLFLDWRPKKKILIFSYFEYIGLNSIGIFLIHRVLFLKILAPTRLHIGSYFGLVMTNSFFELFIYFNITILVFHFLKKNNFFGSIITK
jgi:hypothetical protein